MLDRLVTDQAIRLDNLRWIRSADYVSRSPNSTVHDPGISWALQALIYPIICLGLLSKIWQVVEHYGITVFLVA